MKNISVFICSILILSTTAFGAEHIFAKNSKSFMKQLSEISKHSPDQIIQVTPEGTNNKSVYKSGDLYIFLAIGKKDETMTKDEYQKLWGIMNYLSSKGFRVMMNVMAKVTHLEEAINSIDTSVILWSGHGNKNSFYDYDGNAVPHNIFNNAHESLYQFVLSSCYGRLALNKNYSVPDHIKTWAWSGLTNSGEFMSFLVSDKWSATKKI